MLVALAGAAAAGAWVIHHDARIVDAGEFEAMIDGALEEGAASADVEAFLRNVELRERGRITIAYWPPEPLDDHPQLRCTGRPPFAGDSAEVLLARVSNKYHGLTGLYQHSFSVMFVLDESGTYVGHRTVQGCAYID